MKQTLEFIPDTHIYRLMPLGQVIPSVSSIISAAFPFNGKGVHVDRAVSFGKAVHRMIELEIKGELDFESIDPALKPYFYQWKIFCNEFLKVDWSMELYHTELSMYSPNHLFAGTADLIAKDYVVDIKTGQKNPRHRLQIAAYHAMGNEIGKCSKKDKGIIVYLNGTNEMPEIVEEQKGDFETFLSCKSIYDFKARNK